MADYAPFVQELKEIETEQLGEILDFLNEEPFTSSAEYKKFRSDIKVVRSSLASMRVHDFDGYDKADIEEKEKALNDAKAFMAALFDPNKNLSAAEIELKKRCVDAWNDMQKPDNHYDKVINTYKDYIQFVDDIHSGKIEQDILEAKQSETLFGKKPTIDEILNFKPDANNISKTMDTVVWIATCQGTEMSLYGRDLNQNIYSQTFSNFLAELTDSSYEVQEQYVKELLIRESALADKAYEKYEEFLKNSTSEPKEKDAMLQLYKTDEYQACAGFYCAFKQMLTMCPSGAFIMWQARLPHSESDKMLSTRPSGKINEFVVGGMSRFFEEHKMPYGMLSDAFALEYAEKKLSEEGYINSEDFLGVIDEYKNLNNDKEKASESFDYMRDTLNALMKLDTGDIKSDKYGHLLKTARDAAKQYHDSHKSYRFTENGKKRQASAKNLEEKLSHLYDQYQLRVGKKIDMDAYKNQPKTLQGVFTALTLEASKSELTLDELVEKVQSERPEPLDPNTILAEKDRDLIVPENEREARKALSKKAEATLIKAEDLRRSCILGMKKGIKYGEFTQEELGVLYADRDLQHLLFDYGYDGETTRRNMDVAKKLIASGQTPAKKNEIIGQYVTERIDRLAKFNFERFLGLNDEDFVDNYMQFQYEFSALSTLEADMRLFKDNPNISKETFDKAQLLVNKYCNLQMDFINRMAYIGSPMYEVIDSDKLYTRNDVISDLEMLDSNPVTRYIDAITYSNRGRSCLMADRIRMDLAKNPASVADMNTVSFYDDEGNTISDIDVANTIYAGKHVIAVSFADPTVIKEYSFDDKLKLKSGSPKLDPEKLEEIFKSKLTEAYKTEAKRRLALKERRDGYYTDALTDMYLGMGSFFYDNKLEELGYVKKTTPELSLLFNDFYMGVPLEEISKNENYAVFKDDLESLYNAAQIDIKYKNLRESTLYSVSENIDFVRPNKESLNRTIDELHLPRVEDKEKIKELQTKLKLAINGKMANNNNGVSTSNRAFNIAKINPELKEEERCEISEKSRSFEGRKEIIHGIVDETLCIDLDYVFNLTVEQVANDYDKAFYLQNMAWDPSYLSGFSKEAEGILTPYEHSLYKEFLSTIQSPLNNTLSLAEISVSEFATHVDVEKMTYQQILQATERDKANSAIWMRALPAKFDALTEEKKEVGMKAYNDLVQSRWVNALLSQDGLPENEIELINSFNSELYAPRGRAGMYPYAVQKILKAAVEKPENMTAEQASYYKLMGQAGKYLYNQIQSDGYELDNETLMELKQASNDLSKIKADVTIALKKGRALNEKEIKLEKEFHTKMLQKKRENLIEKAQAEQKQEFNRLQKAIAEKKTDAFVEHSSKLVYLHDLAERLKDCPDEKIENFPGLDKLTDGDTAKQYKKDFVEFAKENPEIKIKDDKDAKKMIDEFNEFRSEEKVVEKKVENPVLGK